jgi:hypothetical protein
MLYILLRVRFPFSIVLTIPAHKPQASQYFRSVPCARSQMAELRMERDILVIVNIFLLKIIRSRNSS